ncbi:hypothetical protein [uncultured Maribacter sp.]|uniref:hypothetical protein n=1 Tax=uncultured Maribacter sp. TaxID=431308 RepID=UPI002619C432|nr:hypothetical protein [uncultured Maribacter sp.]
MTAQHLVGKYNVIGSNQDEEKNTYKGVLSLLIDSNSRIIAKWEINNSQIQSGTGFFKNNILVINFKYKGDANITYKGVVVYQCLTPNILDGFWSEEFGNPSFLGEERCFRITEKEESLN